MNYFPQAKRLTHEDRAILHARASAALKEVGFTSIIGAQGGREAVCFARPRGYLVSYRTDTGKPHIAKPRRACSAR